MQCDFYWSLELNQIQIDKQIFSLIYFKTSVCVENIYKPYRIERTLLLHSFSEIHALHFFLFVERLIIPALAGCFENSISNRSSGWWL